MKVKTSVVAIFFMLLMVVSTFAFTFLQAEKSPTSGGAVTLPANNIIDYELTADQESLAIGQGKVITKFYYYTGCTECSQQLSFLEYMANQYSNQIILEELTTSNTASLSMNSYYGDKNLVNATQEQIFKAYCDIMLQPPVQCAVG